jgi:Flp pilus assembly secretin CpaC/tetratricopeptide (TPR) repeat protein
VEYRLFKGIKYYNEQDYSKAEEEFKWVIESIKWFPYRADLMNYQTQAESYLKLSLEKKEIRERELTRRRESAARQLAVQDEEKRKEEFIRNIDALFQQAQTEFEKENYENVVKLCERILEMTPGHFVAEKLRTIALIAHRSKVKRVTTDNTIEEWKRIFESYDRKILPYLDPVNFPEREKWEKIQRRGPKKIFKEKPVSELNKQTELILKRKIKFPFTEPTPLSKIIEYIREIIPELNIIIDKASVQEEETILYVAAGLPLDFVLKNMLSTKGWDYFIRDGVVIITSQERILQEEVETRWYNILDLTIPIIDFPGQEIAFAMPQEQQETAVQLPTIAGDQLIEIIKETTAKQEGGWEKVSPPVYNANTGVLVITHLPSVHKQIESLLNQIRTASDVVVTIEGRFLKVQQSFLEDIGVDLRGLPQQLPDYFTADPPDGPDFTDRSAGIVGVYRKGRQSLLARVQNFITNADPYLRFISDEQISPIGGAVFSSFVLGETSYRALLTAVQKNIKTTEVFAPKITIANGQRAHIQMTDQFTYIKDYDVMIVNAAASIAMGEPIVDTFRTGIVLDVRPIVSSDLKYVMMELRPTVVSSATRLPEIRQIPFLIGNVVWDTPQQIELPEIDIQRARGNAIIPDGGVLVMACYASGKDIIASSGVPVLSKIPLLSFMFGRRAKGEGRRVLLILIKTKISILSEEEKKRF